ncbi:hypothetical protein [Rothia koreensis]|uniref:hypothetical protein n=1 Tax=Rothia koreensis TaxID=592378 RepID=UPI003FCEB6C9
MSGPIGEIRFTSDDTWGRRLVADKVIQDDNGEPITLDWLNEHDVRLPIYGNGDGTVSADRFMIDGVPGPMNA